MTTRTAGNTIFLIRGTDGNEQIVETFRVTETSKSPKRALQRFLDLVLGDEDHELFDAAQDGELSYMSGHTQPVTVGVQPVVNL
jgi:hypothetical protein